MKKLNKDYISLIAESKSNFHKKRAGMAYEEKFKIIIALQKIDQEMSKNKTNRRTNRKLKSVWPVEDKK